VDNEARIGVYICHCGSNIAGTVDVEGVTEFAKGLPHVTVARHYTYMCSDPGQELIKSDIKEHGLNRIVVASCSPRMHELTFRRACESGGVNPYLFQMANIREHCSWISDDPEAATEKTKALVNAAVRRVYYQEPLSIGGHMAQFDKTFPTLDCASCIFTPLMSEVGQHPNIKLMSYSEVEEVSGYIGNFTVKIRKKARYVNEDLCTGCGVCQEKCPWKADSEFDEGLMQRKAIYISFPQAVPNVPVIDTEHCAYFLKGTCRACEKFCEAKAIDFEQEDQIVEVDIGHIIVATGYDSFDPSVISQYGYGRYDNVITALQFERMCNASGPTDGKILLKDGSEPESVAIIHCVGSRDKNYHEYCSRVCCMYALKYSHLIKEKTNADVYQMYIDMRCFGKGYEEFYERLSDEGVNFIRGKVDQITDKAVNEEEKGKLIVACENTLLGSMMRVPVDMVILCTALEAKSDAESVTRLFNISRSGDGFFLERHPKLDPVATTTGGVFVVGCCQGPKDIPDTVAQASAAAARALAVISKGKVEIEAAVAVIDEELCSGCRICNLLCPFDAISFDEEEKVSEVNEALCKGCGVCVAACPSGAITGKHFTVEQIVAELEGVLV